MKLEYTEHQERVSKYKPFENTLKMQGMTYPVALSQVSKIEDQNNLCINVFGYEDDELYVLHVSEKQNLDMISLLLISYGQNIHYMLIHVQVF